MKFSLAIRAGITALREKEKNKPNGAYKLKDGSCVKYAEAAQALRKHLAWLNSGLDSEMVVRVVPCVLCKFYGKNYKTVQLDKSCTRMCLKHGVEVTDNFFCKEGIDNQIGD